MITDEKIKEIMDETRRLMGVALGIQKGYHVSDNQLLDSPLAAVIFKRLLDEWDQQ